MTLRNLVSPSELMQEPESIPFLVQDVAPLTGLAVLWGPSGVMKTFIVLDMAFHVAVGQSWHGRAVTQGDVVYVAAEGFRGLRPRLAAWCAEHGFTAADLDGLIAFRRVAWDITSSTVCDEVRQEVAAEKLAPKLIILDTLSANAPPGFKENDTGNMKLLMDAARILRDEYECLVLLVHHTGLDTSRMRGNTDLYAALDVSIGVKKTGEMTRRVFLDKARDFAAPEPFTLEMVSEHGSVVVRRPTRRADTDHADVVVFLELLTVLGRHTYPVNSKTWQSASGRSAEFFIKQKKALIAAELVTVEIHGKREKYAVSPAGRDFLTRHEIVSRNDGGTMEEQSEGSDPTKSFRGHPFSTEKGTSETIHRRADPSAVQQKNAA